jgi:hypothetical protein
MVDGAAGSTHLTVEDLTRSRDVSLSTRNLMGGRYHIKVTHTPSGMFSECDASTYDEARDGALAGLRDKLISNGSPPLR